MPRTATAQRDAETFTVEQVHAIAERAFRAGYGKGADGVQLERRGRPFLTEDEAVDEWRKEPLLHG